jgi:hypothetical protein
VIVATGTLELGIDVGDLDRVVQIDAPRSVSSFLQRMGRTGRRPGAARNCLVLATTDDALLRGAAVMRLWAAGYVEPAAPPPLPLHILAQQVMALALQEHGLIRGAWRAWVGAVPEFASPSASRPRPLTRRRSCPGSRHGRLTPPYRTRLPPAGSSSPTAWGTTWPRSSSGSGWPTRPPSARLSAHR